ncbi:histidinol-phosphate transaminase [Polycladomyces subterraneus]|uniref:Histidinol-phosphate aminotransferase n=1 Tax=Polycladomyces subterraneus TaxID=1016997 RepID=A0ABT8INA6_9BACL|nr:histidinol-phosphate transaminase [Polycladomyces subterraneus]MDN4594238.1 histidinol-phosphate transaminase [Polycladomyces subterraneus]
MKPKAAIRGLPVYQPGKPLEEVKRELGLTEVIKLASNENPFGCSPAVWESLAAEREFFAMYPEGAAPDLRKELAHHLGIDEARLIFGNGSDEVVQMLARAYLEPGCESVMADRTFPRYETLTRMEGATPVEVPLVDGTHDFEAMASAVNERTRIVWICNPNNPTGTIVDQDALVRFLDRMPDHVLVVVDEAYYEYVTDPSYPDTISLLDRYPQLFILRTFSKIYGLAAFRIGYGIGHPDVVTELNRVREPFNVNRLAQRAARAALADQAFVERCRRLNREGVETISRQLHEWGLSHFPSHGNFVLLDTGKPADEVFQSLLKQGIIVRSGQALGYPTHIRVTVGSPEQNARFLDALAVCLGRQRNEAR